MKRKLLRKSNFIKTGKHVVDVKPASSVERELAVSRALSALCGGSGVGQAPEPPHSAQSQDAESIKADRISLQASAERSRSTPEPPSREARENYDSEIQNSKSEKIVSLQDPNTPRSQIKENAVFLPVAPLLKFQIPKSKSQINSKSQNLKRGELKSESEIQDRIIGNVREKIGEGGDKGKDVLRITNYVLRTKKLDFRKITRNFLTLASIILILTSVAGFGYTFGPVIKAEITYQINQKSNIKNQNDSLKIKNIRENPLEISGNPRVNSKKLPNILPITAIKEVQEIKFPASSSIVIPKIEASSEFFVNTDASNYDEYFSVLQKGVAHAKGTALPGEVGNAYFFAHSAGNLFDVARFNAVFYLISNLEKGDSIYVSFGNQKFKYTVYDKKEVEATDVEYLTNRKDNGRMLTLQTCTPPGTDWRRLLVFARIQE